MANPMRIPPVAHGAWTPELREVLRSFAAPFAELGLSGNEAEKDALSPVVSTVLNRLDLARAFFPFAKYLLTGSSLSRRENELVVLRVSWLRRAHYEWSHHSASAIEAGLLTEDEVASIASGSSSAAWSQKEAALLAAVYQLVANGDVDDAAWAELARHFDQAQLIDIVFLVGGYLLVGLYVNAFKVPLKEGMSGIRS